MGLRQTMNEKPALSIGFTAGIILLAIIIIVYELSGGRGSSASSAAMSQTFFSDDDGKTFFADDISKLPPFNHNGKMAYKVAVFRCGSNGKPFVTHLERFTDEGKKKMEEMKAKSGRTYTGMGAMTMMEVKKPGQTQWVRLSNETSKQWSDVMRPTCPDGSTPEPVVPGQQ